MIMRKNNQRKPVSPIYAFGIVFLLYSIFFDLSGFGGLIKCALLAWAISALVKSIVKKDKKEEQQKDPVEEPKKNSKKTEPKPEPEPKQ